MMMKMMKMKGFLLSSIFWNGSRTHLETAPKSRVAGDEDVSS